MPTSARAPPPSPTSPCSTGLRRYGALRWEADQVYAFDRTRPRAEVFSIDTPPPTVSGSLHVGHAFSYTHTDIVARYRRMTGRSVFYPIGWDDNGLPTERRVQNVYGVRGDASLPYDPSFAASFVPPEKPGKTELPVSRRNFIELCERLTAVDERVFEEMWRRIGLSVDWSLLYTTISDSSRRVSQRAFLRNLARGEAYRAEAPTLWDVTFQTAVAQAELEDREVAGAFHRISFHAADGSPVWIETTRPELLPACVALVAHPDDERYRPLFGSSVLDAGVRRAGAGARAPAGRAGQGVGDRDGVHLRRPDRRDLVAGARPAAAFDHRAQRPAAGRAARRRARPGCTRSWRARRCSRPGRGWSSCCRTTATWTGRRGR